jgi:hypothetical protein
MILPKFVFGASSFIPTYPPTQKPLASELEATRHDSLTTSGIKQSISERVDSFLTLKFTSVPAADITAWSSFMAWALAGNTFTYFPDSTLGASTDYTLEDTSWLPPKVFFGHTAFTFRMRQVV